MLRYFAMAWDASSQQQQQLAESLYGRLVAGSPRWRSIMRNDRCLVALFDAESPGSRHCPLSRGRGVILGTLFAGSADGQNPEIRAVSACDDTESAKILSSRGRHLIESYWGSYLAVISEPGDTTTRVLRGPMSGLACLTTEYENVQLYFSHMADAVRLGVLRFSINWRFITRSFAKLTRPEETGIAEVSRLGSGECFEIQRGRTSRHTYWDPLSIAASHPIDDPDEAVQAIHRTTRACVRAWASCHRSVVLELSGGLDSSIVIGCLRDAPAKPAITALLRYSHEADSDERPFARLAARHCDCRLVEQLRDTSFDVSQMLRAKPTEKPQSYLNQLGLGNPLVAFARESDCSATFSGVGGDEVFFNAEPGLAVADYVYRHGIRPRLLQYSADAARLNAVSVWRILRQAIARGARKYRWDPIELARRYDPLVRWDTARLLQEQSTCYSRWFARDRYVPPGKQVQISGLIRYSDEASSSAFAEPGDPDRVEPLLSQPLVEIAMRIPTYLCIAGGWERAIARRAFAAEVPREILRRRWKGMQEGYTAQVFARNLGFMREMLLDGVLVSEGLLDRSKLESALSGGPSNVMQGMRKISNHLSLEAWFRIWTQHGVRLRGIPAALSGSESPELAPA